MTLAQLTTLNDNSSERELTIDDGIAFAKELLHAEEAYFREDAILGAGFYTWNENFITLIQQSLAENKIANFSKPQRVVFDKYILLLTDGITGNESEDIIELDTYLGGLQG